MNNNGNTFENGIKQCTKCKESKARDSFYTFKGEASRECKACVDARNKEWQLANPEKHRASQVAWRAKNEGRTYTDKTTGYVQYVGFQHPVANPAGITRYHRIILFNKIGNGPHLCHWGCGKAVSWDKSYPYDVNGMVADHVNGDKSDNRPENLVASCGRCNLTRPGVKKPRRIKSQVGPCSVEGCQKDARTLSLCGAHYQQQKAGKPFTSVRTYQKTQKNQIGKVCTGCEEHKSYENFYARSGGKGYQNQCKECMIENNRKNTLDRLAETA
jgi:hypothetical protein